MQMQLTAKQATDLALATVERRATVVLKEIEEAIRKAANETLFA